MQAFMWQEDLIDIAMFVNACLNRGNVVTNFWDAAHESTLLQGGQHLTSLV